MKNTITQYGDAGIQTFGRGLLFDSAYLKTEIGGLIERLRFLSLGGIEISENYITLTEAERDKYIGGLTDAGLELVFEYGQKFPELPMDLADLESAIDRVTAIGAHHVIVEQGEFDLLAAERNDRAFWP